MQKKLHFGIFIGHLNRSCLYVLAAVIFLVSANSGHAMDIASRIGITARGGMVMPSDSRLSGSDVKNLNSDNGMAFNGGIMLGCAQPNDNFAFELESTYSKYNLKVLGVRSAEITSYDISAGLQYRFIEDRRVMYSPYLGFGLDLLLNDMKLSPLGTFLGNVSGQKEDPKIDVSYGAHVKLGNDFFITRDVAINTEAKGVWGAMTDAHDSNVNFARYNPSSISGLVGIRYFFN